MREGRYLTLVAWGAMVSRCLQVADLAAGDGIDVEVLDLRWREPIDAAALETSAQKTRRAVVVDGTPSGDLEDEYIPNIDRILFYVQRVLECRRG